MRKIMKAGMKVWGFITILVIGLKVSGTSDGWNGGRGVFTIIGGNLP